jgi:hypothetical protein
MDWDRKLNRKMKMLMVLMDEVDCCKRKLYILDANNIRKVG